MLEHRYDKRNEQVDFLFLLLKLRAEEMMGLIVGRRISGSLDGWKIQKLWKKVSRILKYFNSILI